jgi:hypothetical protein
MPSTSHKVLARGYQIRGASNGGYAASVPYLVTWANAFTFIDEVMGSTSGSTTLPPTWTNPHKLPYTGSAKLYANEFQCEPCGADGSAIPNEGILPGEYFTHAKVTVTYKTPELVQASGDDASHLFQLDPANPLTLCEQRVRQSSKVTTRKGGGYVFEDGTPLVGDMGVPETESELVLTFPRVSWLPWAYLKPYHGTVNLTSLFGCPKGNLLLTGSDIQYVQDLGAQLKTQAQLVFSVQHDDRDWNEVEKSDGTWMLVKRRGDTTKRIFRYVEHKNIFTFSP